MVFELLAYFINFTMQQVRQWLSVTNKRRNKQINYNAKTSKSKTNVTPHTSHQVHKYAELNKKYIKCSDKSYSDSKIVNCNYPSPVPRKLYNNMSKPQ